MKSLESRKLAEVNALVGAAILLSIVSLAVETVVVKSHLHVLLSLTNIVFAVSKCIILMIVAVIVSPIWLYPSEI